MAWISIYTTNNKKMKEIYYEMKDLDIEMFFGFLKDESVYYKYLNNLIKRRNVYNIVDFKILFQQNDELLSNAFDFEYTSEGFAFWYEIHKKWERLIELQCFLIITNK